MCFSGASAVSGAWAGGDDFEGFWSSLQAQRNAAVRAAAKGLRRFVGMMPWAVIERDRYECVGDITRGQTATAKYYLSTRPTSQRARDMVAEFSTKSSWFELLVDRQTRRALAP